MASRLPSDVKKVFHPIICCALSADLAAVAFGYFSRLGLDPVLGNAQEFKFSNNHEIPGNLYVRDTMIFMQSFSSMQIVTM